MKNWLLLLTVFLVALFVMPLSSQASSPAKFPDVNYNTEMGRAIDFLQQQGIVQGFPNGTFQPYRLVTRGQAAKMISEVTYSKPMFTESSNFKDVARTHEYFEPIHALFEYNVISGYADGTFRMQQNINRAQVSKMIASAFVLREPTTNVNFTDISKSNDRYLYANRAYAAGIMPYVTFYPNKTVSRGEMALFLYRAYGKTAADLTKSQSLAPFIGTNTTLGQAWKGHSFMQSAIRQRMPIAAVRQSLKIRHHYAGYDAPYPWSFFSSNTGDFNLGYYDGTAGKEGVVTVSINNYDMKQHVQVAKLKQALGTNAFTIETATLESGELLYQGYTKNAVNGLYYSFNAYGGSAASALTIDASIVTQMVVSLEPITY